MILTSSIHVFLIKNHNLEVWSAPAAVAGVAALLAVEVFGDVPLLQWVISFWRAMKLHKHCKK